MCLSVLYPRLFSSLCNLHTVCYSASALSLCLVRWSRYNPYYLDPDPSKDARVPESELSPEEKELQDLKTVRPIKAALSSDTSSPFNDPLIR